MYHGGHLQTIEGMIHHVEARIISGDVLQAHNLSVEKAIIWFQDGVHHLQGGWCPADDILIHHFLLQLDGPAGLDHVDMLTC